MDSSDTQRSELRGGLKVDTEVVGTGAVASRGDSVVIRLEIRLNHGDVVATFDEYAFVVGKRQVIAAIDYAVEGMHVGGRRELKAGPHLCYGAAGVSEKIPSNAALFLSIELLRCEKSG
ncbi:FKBP-type peptidyl-prolyl cis-trans isomerase [Roseiconus lacunae]|uniref:Peptidyl-prolyl cis-trans isomerase n=1 Tax=Roseiconus lacunae TaxID=2605694 RepID=A0ABT7PBD1_9BACT|nr:FKBP-type peptidyl-prolyl cis-trans isomerase [Roseiconus lacunae]MDM4013794.1 FKBP-type peptidyl-prolyl cis-trans isomerase [Roseiconus lacunae]